MIVNGACNHRIRGRCRICLTIESRQENLHLLSLVWTISGLSMRGRCMEKRYGDLFTCLALRAVHIEVAHSLDTSSFINAFRRFIARRGSPRVIRSDNGTNLTSGEKELREAIGGWSKSKIGEFLLQKEVRWVFNPPAASHMGGIWEWVGSGNQRSGRSAKSSAPF